jgi:hypothetical protein
VGLGALRRSNIAQIFVAYRRSTGVDDEGHCEPPVTDQSAMNYTASTRAQADSVGRLVLSFAVALVRMRC